MRILFLINFYPPHYLGGLELVCQSVVAGLQKRGHETLVLTSDYECSQPITENGVARQLHLEMDFAPLRNAIDFFVSRQRRKERNRQILREHIRTFAPDVVFVWGMWNLHRVLAKDAESLMPGRVLYCFHDYWPSLPPQYVHYWQEPGRHNLLFRYIKRVLRPVALSTLRRERTPDLSFKHSYCVSHAVKDELLRLGVSVQDAEVINFGIDLDLFSEVTSAPQDPCKLLYIGRLSSEKGPQISVQALSHLVRAKPELAWSLSIIGNDESAEALRVKDLVHREGLSERVHFRGSVPYEEIPMLLQEHAVLVVPSLWPEPFPKIVIEGMAAARVVAASRTGGIPEIIEHDRTGKLFEPGNVRQLVQILEELAGDPVLSRRLARAGREAAFRRFTLKNMMDRVEQLLEKVAAQH